MVVNKITHMLMDIGLSEYEARAYIALLGKNPVTAYELARVSSIPTSKIYEVLSRLFEKGVVSTLGENGVKRFIPIEPDEFIESHRSKLETTLKTLKEGLTGIEKQADVSYIWNIKDYSYLMDKAGRMILEARKTLLISIWKEEMAHLEEALRKAANKKVRIAIIHFGTPMIKVGQIFQHPIENTIYTEKGGRGLVVVADSKEVLMGTVFKDNNVEGAWSMNRGFAMMAEDYIKHDIYIMKVVMRFDKELKKRFGDKYIKLRDVFKDEELK
jgi:sugar-specific transcriptional regulator TrmB